MQTLVAHALTIVVVAAGLGALLLCALALGVFNRNAVSRNRLSFMGIGFLVAAVCLATTATVAVIAQLYTPAQVGLPTTAPGQVKPVLEARLERLAEENARLSEQLVALRGHVIEELRDLETKVTPPPPGGPPPGTVAPSAAPATAASALAAPVAPPSDTARPDTAPADTARPDSPQATPRRGGELVFVVPAEPPSYDAHREETFALIHPAAPHYNTLLRIDPNDGTGTRVVGDLAESW